MLFILAMDVLNRFFIKAGEAGVLQPLGHNAIKFQCSLYADHVILRVSPTAQDASSVAAILEVFGAASGLHTNMEKCSITPILGCEDALEDIEEC